MEQERRERDAASEAQGPLSVSSGLPDFRALGQKDEWPGVCPAGLC